jgi:hypothetical protein
MSTLALVALMAGFVLGMRYRFFILIPTTVLAIVMTVTLGVAHGDTAASIALGALLAAACLQGGYFAGLLARLAPVAMRTARRHKPLALPHPKISRHAH